MYAIIWVCKSTVTSLSWTHFFITTILITKANVLIFLHEKKRVNFSPGMTKPPFLVAKSTKWLANFLLLVLPNSCSWSHDQLYQERLKNRIESYVQIRAPKNAAYYVSPIEIGVFWLEIKCLKSASRLLNRVWFERQGLDLSKEVLWVSVCQRAAKLPAGKVGGLKKNSAMWPGAGESVSNPAAWQNLFSNFQLCQLVTRLHFDIQRPTVLL